jgi:HEAT repeat protein
VAPPALGADDKAATPLIFFRKPDSGTEKLIRNELIGGNGIGAGTRDKRAEARRRLIVIDAWAVPYLAEALYGRKARGAHTIRMNAAATLSRILDPRALPELRGASSLKEKDKWVRRSAVLSLGLYRRVEDVALFDSILDRRDRKLRDPTAALALGKIDHPNATNALLSRLGKPPQDVHLTAGILLAASIRSPDTPAAEKRFIEHKKRLVRRVAAACLLIRPPTPSQTKALLKIVNRTGDREVRELQYYALGLVPGRTPEIREALLDCAVNNSKHKTGARVAALIGLADELNERANFPRLYGCYRTLSARNDPVVAALLHAMVRTGEKKAIDICLSELKKGSTFLRFYASAALFHHIALSKDAPPRAAEIAGAIARQRSRTQNPQLLQLIDLVGRWRSPPEGVKDRSVLAREGLIELGDPRELHLFDRTREERAWALVNQMLPHILELDDLIVDLQSHDTSSVPAPDPGAGKKKSESGSEEELDMLDFLREQPYFVPRDLGKPKEADE